MNGKVLKNLFQLILTPKLQHQHQRKANRNVGKMKEERLCWQMTFGMHNRGDHKMISRTFYFVNKDEVIRDGDHFGKPLPGIMKARSVLGLSRGFIGIINLSCYCNMCIVNNYKQCENDDYVKL